MNKILRVIPHNDSTCLIECEPGITLKEIGRFLAAGPQAWPGPPPEGKLPDAKHFFYPPDPTEMDAELGGTVATNASGARSYLFGATRTHVEAISIVLASGETATVKRGCFSDRNGKITLRTDQGTTYAVPLPDIKLQKVKNAAGYFIEPGMDLIDLLIGSEGTLAIFSSITIHVRQMSNFLSGLSFFKSRDGAFSFADFLRKEQHVAAIEYFDSSALALLAAHRSGMLKALPDFPPGGTALLWEFSEDEGAAFENEMERWESALSGCGSSFDKTLAGFDDQGRERLKVFRHAVPEFVNNVIALNKSKFPSIRKVSTDTAVPLERFRSVFAQQIELIEQTGIRYAIFGHLGDGHLHINLMPDNDHEMTSALETYDRLMTIAIDNGGTISAEHGIGKLKKKYLLKMYGEDAIGAMKRIKNVFDPDGLLNPGNLFD
jgi:D-lactate dehydrogenase (cytochrome)